LTPELLDCNRRSFLTACMKAAADGLYPDGIEGAIVVRWSREGKTASWQPMVRGLQKKVRNSGEIDTWESEVVRERDQFAHEKGDAAFIRHAPYIGAEARGPIVAAYSICTLKSGAKLREVMSIGEIHEIRDTYSESWKAWKAGKFKTPPTWVTSEGEMARKTVMRRHAKYLPMSTDIMDIVHRLDEDTTIEAPQPAPEPPRRDLAAKLQLLGTTPAPEEKPVGSPEDQISVDPETGEVGAGSLVAPVEPAPTADPVPAGEVELVPSTVEHAYREGRQARRDGYQRKAMPGAYRDDAHAAEAEAWLRGWVDEDRDVKAQAKGAS
jgi:recombination protein RecT